MSANIFDKWLYNMYHSTSCHFCDLNFGEEGCEVELNFYKKTASLNQKSKIKIPRCKSCKEMHKRNKRNRTLIFLFSEIITLVIFVSLALNHNGYVFSAILIGLFVGIFLGGIISRIYELKGEDKNLKKDNKSTFLEHPVVIQRIKEGWFLDEI